MEVSEVFWHVYSTPDFYMYVCNHVPLKVKGEISNWDAFAYAYRKYSDSGQEVKLQTELITSKVSSQKHPTLDSDEQTFNRDNAEEQAEEPKQQHFIYTPSRINPFAPELPVTACADPGPFYPLWRHQF